MRLILVLIVASVCLDRAVADDWTGKTVRVKEDGLKLGRKLGGGLVRDGAALDKTKTYLVKSGDGTLLELDGGFVFLSDVEVVADAKPVPEGRAKETDPVAAKGEWFGKEVLPKRREEGIRIGDWVDDKQIYWEPYNLMNCTVREDRDGFLRVHDGRREGWVDKADFVTAEDAPIFWDKAVKANSSDAYALCMRGVGWKDKGEYDNAIRDFTEVIRLEPSWSSAYNWRGIAWRNKKEYDKAIADYDEALRLDPKYVTAYNNRGNAWSSRKEYGKAIADYTEAIRLDPKMDYAIGNLAETNVKLKKYAAALTGFEEAIELNPMDWLCRYFARFRASCPEAKYRDGTKAVSLAKKAIEKAGREVDWQYHDVLAMAHAEVGDFELAVSEQRKALELLAADKSGDADDRRKAEARLALYRDKKAYRDEE